MFSIFLSYHRTDGAAVSAIRNFLQSGGINTFLDSTNLTPGLPWMEPLEQALTSVDAVAAFVGKEIGIWQRREISFALNRQAEAERQKQKFLVIPVLLPGSHPSVVPGFLQQNTFVDLRSGLDNTDQMGALLRAINGDAASQTPLTVGAVSPYRHLSEFREEDAAFFRGREAFANRLFEAVSNRQLVALIGNSGSGKSSVAQAGLIPLLRRESRARFTWDIAISRPRKAPFDDLAEALAPLLLDPNADKISLAADISSLAENLRTGKAPLRIVVNLISRDSRSADRLLLIVDQFEELFSIPDPGTQTAFVQGLLDAVDKTNLHILLIFRADFYGRVIGLDRVLSNRIEQGIVNLGPPTTDELRRAIEDPAHLVGLEFESKLVDRILNDAGQEPGSLPLVEFALSELALPNRRRGNLLTHESYEAIEQVAGSIAKRADDQWEQLSEEQRKIAPAVFTRLVRVAMPGEGGLDARQVADISDLSAEERGVIESFTQARLLVVGREERSGREFVQVAHEALIRKWKKLEQWVNERRRLLLWRQRLNLRMAEWNDGQRDPGALLYKASLAEARAWREQAIGELSDQERAFIEASEEQERVDREALSRVAGEAVALRLAADSGRLLDEEPAELERRSLLLAVRWSLFSITIHFPSGENDDGAAGRPASGRRSSLPPPSDRTQARVPPEVNATNSPSGVQRGNR